MKITPLATRSSGNSGRRPAYFGGLEAVEVESANVRVAPLLGLGIGEVELLEDVERLKPALGQPARFVKVFGEALGSVSIQHSWHM